MAFRHLSIAHCGREDVVTAARRRTAQLAGAAAQPLEMLPGHRFHHPGKPHQAAAAGDILAHVPVGQRIQVTDRVCIVKAIEDAGQTAVANPLQKQRAFHPRPGQQMFWLEERVQVNEALDVQAHLVFAVDGMQTDEDTAVYQCQLLLGAAGREHEIDGQVIHH